jgi:hypothetical protein
MTAERPFGRAACAKDNHLNYKDNFPAKGIFFWRCKIFFHNKKHADKVLLSVKDNAIGDGDNDSRIFFSGFQRCGENLPTNLTDDRVGHTASR